MSAVSTLTVNTVAFVFLLATLISPMNAEQLSESIGINRTEQYSVRHQQHRVQSGGTNIDGDTQVMYSDERRERGITGGGMSNEPKYIAVAYNSSPIFIEDHDEGPMFRAINNPPNKNASFMQKALCGVDDTIDEWFRQECDVDSSSYTTHAFPLVYIIEFIGDKYLMCADEKEKSVIPVKRSDIQNREGMKRCVWDTMPRPKDRSKVLIRSYFPSRKQKSNCNSGLRDKCTKYTFMFAKSKRKSSKMRLKLRTLPWATHEKKVDRKLKYEFIIFSQPHGQTWSPTTTSPGQGRKTTPNNRRKNRRKGRKHGKKKGSNNLFSQGQKDTPSFFAKDNADAASPRRHQSVLDRNHKFGL